MQSVFVSEAKTIEKKSNGLVTFLYRNANK